MNSAPPTAAQSTAADPALTVADLTVTMPGRGRSGSRITVLDRVSVRVAPGECLAIVGSSGAGKSVLARSLLGLADPAGNSGWRSAAERFEIAGHDMSHASGRSWRALRGSKIALVLQDALQSLDPLRTIEAEVGEAVALRGVPRRARRSAVISALTAAGLRDPESLLGLTSDALSGGMRQRALIASALIGSPAVLVADEPTTALDPATSRQVLTEFGRLRDSGVALIVVSHDLGAVASIADRIAVLDRGRIVETGPAARLLASPEQPATRALVAAIPQVSRPGASPALREREPERPGGTPVATFASATRSYGDRGGRFTGIRDVDLEIHRGEILGVAGESGAGKTTLARLLAGAERPDSGSLTFAAGAGCDSSPRTRSQPSTRAGGSGGSLRRRSAAPTPQGEPPMAPRPPQPCCAGLGSTLPCSSANLRRSQAVNGSGSPSPERSPPGPTCSSATRPCQRWTPSPRPGSSTCCGRCAATSPWSSCRTTSQRSPR
nr:ATP-binding cassette domain-containing protein [Leucobacter komagatae]